MSHSFPELKVETTDKSAAFEKARAYLSELNFKIVNEDKNRPWGFFFYVDPAQAKQFVETFYGDIEFGDLDFSLPMQPKLLGIAPDKRLSWQWHKRRSEHWRCIGGTYLMELSDTDEETAPIKVTVGGYNSIGLRKRHRGEGTDEYGFVAEIWVHQDKAHPSDEDDITRVQDDYGRS